MADQADGGQFFSLGLNHIDPASLRYPENIHIWRDKYGGSMQRWLQESVAPNLKAWASTPSDGFRRRPSGNGNIRGRSLMTNTERWDCPTVICSPSPSHTSGTSTRPLRLPQRRLAGMVRLRGSVALCGTRRRPAPDRLLLQRLSVLDSPTSDNAWRGPIFDRNGSRRKPAARSCPSLLSAITRPHTTRSDATTRTILFSATATRPTSRSRWKSSMPRYHS